MREHKIAKYGDFFMNTFSGMAPWRRGYFSALLRRDYSSTSSSGVICGLVKLVGFAAGVGSQGLGIEEGVSKRLVELVCVWIKRMISNGYSRHALIECL